MISTGWPDRVRRAYRNDERIAVIDADGAVTGSELLALASGALSALDGLDLPPRTPVPALLTTNATALALLLAGASGGRPLAPLGPRLTASELAGPVRATGSPVLLTEPEFAGLAGEIARTTGVRVEQIDAIAPSPRPFPSTGPDPARPSSPVAAYLHTSGTTGAARPVAMGHKALAARCALNAALTGMGPDTVYATGSPLHHIGGIGNIMVAMSVGATVVAARRFSVPWWRGLAPLGVTHALLVPSMIEMLIAEKALNTVELHTLIYGGSPIDPATLRRVLEILPGVRLVNLFGQTEGSPITCLSPEDHVRAARGAEHLLRSVGRAVPGLRLRIADPGTDGVGEVLASAEHLFAPEEDGWLRTGDLGSLDGEGYLYLAGRRHDMVVSGGENVYPTEVEHVLAGHPGVAQAAVAGVPDRRLGETLAAFVVPADPAAPPGEEELRHFVRARLAGFKVPAHWHLVSELPHNAAGKLLRRRLRELHAGRG